jgi:2,5-dichloro-2,5-cyclohexadiene-1,4-diol dehydrogenase 2
MRLAGKVALISGAARGMGAVEARLFAQEGAKVILGDILEAEGRKVEADIRAAGGEAVFVRLDVTRSHAKPTGSRRWRQQRADLARCISW